MSNTLTQGTLESGTSYAPTVTGSNEIEVLFSSGVRVVGNSDLWSSPRAFAEWVDARSDDYDRNASNITRDFSVEQPINSVEFYDFIPETVQVPLGYASAVYNNFREAQTRFSSFIEQEIGAYIVAEMDENFNKTNRKVRDTLENLLATLGITTALEKTMRGVVVMSNNINRMLSNITNLMNRGISLVRNFVQDKIDMLNSFLNTIYSSIRGILNTIVSVIRLPFDQINSIKSTIQNKIRRVQQVVNTKIIEDLRLDFVNMVNMERMKNTLARQFTIPNIDALTIDVNGLFTTRTSSFVSSNLLKQANKFTLGNDDPLGLVAAETFKRDINRNVRKMVKPIVELHVKDSTVREQVINTIVDNIEYRNNFCLPSLSLCSKGMKADNNNKVKEIFDQAFNDYFDDIVTSIKLTPCSEQDRQDYLNFLNNVKNELQIRLAFKKKGMSIEENRRNREYLDCVLVGGIDRMRDEDLQNKLAEVDEILNRNIEIC